MNNHLIPTKTKGKLILAISIIYIAITLSMLHAKERRDRWKEGQIELSTGGYND